MTTDYIYVITDTVLNGDRAPSHLPNPFSEKSEHTGSAHRPRTAVPVERLEQGMADFLQAMGRVIHNAQNCATEVGNMELDEVELSVEINGEGQLSLLGSGGKLGGSGAMTLRFKKKNLALVNESPWHEIGH